MRRAIAACLLLAPAAALAQDGVTGDVSVFSGGHFFVAMIAGLILAIGFQLVLTNLSMAAGVTALGPFDEPRRDRAVKGTDVTAPFSTRVGRTARKITMAFGLWTLLTASIALFFASWLAVELSFTISTLVAAVLGLVIWALFYVVLVSFEAAAFWSLAGSLTRAVASSLQTAYRATSSVFTPSPQKQIVDTATEVARAVRNELTAGMEVERIREDIQRYVAQLAPPRMDPAAIRQEILSLLDDVELRAVADHEGLDHDRIVARLQARPGWNAEQARTVAKGVGDALKSVREEMRAGKDKVSTATDATLRVVGGMTAEEAQQWRTKFENYLRSTGVQALNPDDVKRDLELLWNEPNVGKEALRARLAQIDRNTIASLVSQRTDLSQEKVVHIIDAVDAFLRNAAARVSETRGAIGDELRGDYEVARGLPGRVDVAGTRDRALSKVQAWIDGLDRPELTYEGLRADMQRLFEDPRAGIDALIARLRAFDRDTVRAMLAHTPGMDQERADKAVDMFLRARDEVVTRVESVRTDVTNAVHAAKVEAAREAEEARLTAASAAWWGFGTAVVSGGAAVAGGLLAAAG